jgi:hypothetical protein
MESKSKYYIYYNGVNVLTLYAHSKYEAKELASFMLSSFKREKLIPKKTKLKTHGRTYSNATND